MEEKSPKKWYSDALERLSSDNEPRIEWNKNLFALLCQRAKSILECIPPVSREKRTQGEREREGI
jgi:hypothetical protein